MAKVPMFTCHLCRGTFVRAFKYQRFCEPCQAQRDEIGFPRSSAAYNAAHTAMYRAYGKASNYLCAICGRDAHEWAFDDKEPMLLDPVNNRRYYPDISRYRPLCRFCHDKGRLEP